MSPNSQFFFTIPFPFGILFVISRRKQKAPVLRLGTNFALRGLKGNQVKILNRPAAVSFIIWLLQHKPLLELIEN